MKYKSKLCVIDHGSQQNGIILGQNCSNYLAEVIIDLSTMYRSTCDELNIINDKFNFTVYEIILPELLNKHAYEDQHHGRLAELMTEFYKFSSHFHYDSSIVYFYLREISIIEDIDIDKVELG